MNIDNVVLVRTMDNLPINGVIFPSCAGKYLIPINKGNYYYIINRIIKKQLEQQSGRILIGTDEDQQILHDALKDFLPLYSRYTSTLSFALNGLVPDDSNNKFNNKKIAILDPIKYHQKEDYVNVDVIDTTIKGSVQTSKEAILVIEQDYFLSLSEEVKSDLMNYYKIEVFTGTLKDAVQDTLKKYDYPSLPLVQEKQYKDILDCEEKESMIEFQNIFAQMQNASRLKLQLLYNEPITSMSEKDALAAEKVQSDFEKNLIVQKYYQDSFYNFLLQKAEQYHIELDEMEKIYLFSEFSKSEEVLEDLVKSLLNRAGVEGYKLLIEEYNNMVQENYLTNDEILEQKTEEQSR